MATKLVKVGLPVLIGAGSIVGYKATESSYIVNGSGRSNSEGQDAFGVVVSDITYSVPATENLSNTGESIGTLSQQETVPSFERNSTPYQEEIDKKAKIKKEAERALNKIDDYTFRIFSPCGVGTGWILDYQLPKTGHEYPTVWYIATNAHVIKDFRFSDNPYKQEMNTSVEKTKKLRNSYWRNRYEHLSLWDDATCKPADWYGYFDLSLSKSKNGSKMRLDKGMYYNNKIEEPKLFYLATNFLDKDESLGVKEENYRDFAVLEIEFKDEKYAEEVTDGFAKRYTLDSTNAINVFAEPLESKYSLEALEKLDENFYNLGYPGSYMGQREKFKYHTNFEEGRGEAARLAKDRYDWYHLKGEERTFGFLDAKRINKGEVKWGNKTKTRVGNFYMVREHKWQNLSLGSSGSMYTDKEGNLIGVKSVRELSEKGGLHSFITPLRSEKVIKGQKGTLVSPAYDLIKGVVGQKHSYKSQVKKYILEKNKNTWLNARGWQHITETNKHLVKKI